MNDEVKNPTSAFPKTTVIIPAYEPPATFLPYVRELVAQNFCDVLIVDDGGGTGYDRVFSEAALCERTTVLRYETNHGKGYALKYAFRYLKEHGNEDDVYVTADCDGQHTIEDVRACAEEAYRHSHALVLGCRCFDPKVVPFHNRFGNVFTRRLFRLLYGIRVTDTQTGLRAFRHTLLDTLLGVKGDRFEYEMNMLMQMHKAGIVFREVPISTVYTNEPNAEGKKSHFRVVRDSVRIIGTLAGNLGWYMISSALSAVVDVLAFFLITLFISGADLPPSLLALIPVVSARVISSIINFSFNFKFVFGGKSKIAVVRYYILWTFQLSLSYLFTFLIEKVVEASILIALCKGLFDLILAFFSYQIQRVWVFADPKRVKHRFFKPGFRLLRSVVRLFGRHWKSFVDEPETPTVFLIRHRNMHGPVTAYRSLRFDTHFLVLHKFFTFRECYRQYADYTFTARYGRRGIRRFFGKIAAFFAALAVPPTVRGARAIPVYRESAQSVITFRRAMECLERTESVTLCPDIDYTASGTSSEIYKGFLYLDKLWQKKHGEHLCFAVLEPDDAHRELSVKCEIRVGGDLSDFDEQMEIAAQKIRRALMD